MKEIMISKNNKGTTIALLENGVLIEKYEDTENKNYLEEKIYLGIVKDILPGMQAAFIDIGEEKNTFIHLKDLLPKIDITKKEEKNDLYKGTKLSLFDYDIITHLEIISRQLWDK